MQSDISSLSEKQTYFDATLKEWELRSGSLEKEIRQSKAEKVEPKGLHVAHEMALQNEINQLKDELIKRRENVEILNKEFVGLKLKFDMLMKSKFHWVNPLHNSIRFHRRKPWKNGTLSLSSL